MSIAAEPICLTTKTGPAGTRAPRADLLNDDDRADWRESITSRPEPGLRQPTEGKASRANRREGVTSQPSRGRHESTGPSAGHSQMSLTAPVLLPCPDPRF